jgi:hypothetical protein
MFAFDVPDAPWKDRPGFGPRFDHPDFHRGPPGPPGMYDDPPHMRHRGRFDDRRRSRPEFGHENAPEGDRFQKRSRWGDSHEDNPREADQSQSVEANGADNKGGNTPLHDEPFNRDVVEGEDNRRQNRHRARHLLRKKPSSPPQRRRMRRRQRSNDDLIVDDSKVSFGGNAVQVIDFF